MSANIVESEMPSTLTDFSSWLRKDTHGNTIQQVKEERRSMSVDHRKYIANTTQRKFDEWDSPHLVSASYQLMCRMMKSKLIMKMRIIFSE